MTPALRVFSALLIFTGIGCNRISQASRSESAGSEGRSPHTTAHDASVPNAVEFTDANFESEVLQAEPLVVVAFSAPWCGPCRMMAPYINELASENQGTVKVGKVNVDDSPITAERHGVSSIPTLMFFRNGEEIGRFVGVQPKSKLQAAIDAAK